jgi:TolB-like protein
MIMKKIAFIHVIFLILYILLVFFQTSALAQNDKYFIGKDSKAFLERVKENASDNYVVAYHLGSVYLNEGKKEDAILEWERYLSMAPMDSKFIAVREHLTILKLNYLEEFAKNAVKQVDSISGDQLQIKENTVAVLDFKNSGALEYNAISKGLAEMIITDLLKVPELNVVERIKIQALIQEIRIGMTEVVEEKTAPKAGRMLLAKNLIWGEYAVENSKKLKISTTVTEILDSTNLGKAEVEGPVSEFFNLEKELVFSILEALGFKEEDLSPSVKKSIRKIQTKNFDAFLNYSKGLDYIDQKDFYKANEAFHTAVKSDPGFDLANEALRFYPKELFLKYPKDISLKKDIAQIQFMEFITEEPEFQRFIQREPELKTAIQEVPEVQTFMREKPEFQTVIQEKILQPNIILGPVNSDEIPQNQLIIDVYEIFGVGKANIEW